MEDYRQKINDAINEISKVVVGQEKLIKRLFIGLFTNGHVLLEGVPGLAKTLTVNALSKVLSLDFSRIQFTPDLLPADLVGTMIYNQLRADFEVKKGPVFTNVLLADEVNRSPAKVQSALLEAMAEGQVTIGETTFVLEKPFLVLATQNPIDQEGTYPLPEAQLDRFMMKVHVHYPSKEQELEVMRRKANMLDFPSIAPKLSQEEVFEIRKAINAVRIEESLERYIIELVFATRDPKSAGLKELQEWIQFGVSPRGSINLNLAAKAWAYMEGRDFVLPEDIKEMASDVLAHRLMLTYEAEAEGVDECAVIEKILSSVPFQ